MKEENTFIFLDPPLKSKVRFFPKLKTKNLSSFEAEWVRDGESFYVTNLHINKR